MMAKQTTWIISLVVMLVLMTTANAFVRTMPGSLIGSKNVLSKSMRMMSGQPPQMDDRTKERIDTLVKGNKVLLFMKGNKIFPQCGFSNTACRILDAINTPYETVNVLEDESIRSAIKVYSSWPTIPQLYVSGEFVGGSDIMIELYNNGELAELIEVANAQ